MKKNFYALLLASSVCFAACDNGAYDANPQTSNTGGNTLNNGSGNNNGGGTSSGFNWSGTDPMSAKINGTAWQAADGTVFDASLLNETAINGETSDYNLTSTGSAFAISVPLYPVPGTVYTCNSTNTSFSFTDAVEHANGGNGNPTAGIYNTGYGGSGAIKITDTTTYIKGYFYGVVKTLGGGATKTITEGYFHIKK